MKEAILLTDGYKLDHRRQYPEASETIPVIAGLEEYYNAIHAGWNPNECEGYTHVFSLRGENIVTRGLLKVKNLLCKRV